MQRLVLRLQPLSPIALMVILSGCFAACHTSSPWEWGGGLRVAPGLGTVGEGDVTVHPMASYTYLSFDGGHDGLWEIGAQLRKPPTIFGERDQLPWLGIEGAASLLREEFEFGGQDFSESFGGFSITALAGVPVSSSRWGPNLYAGAGISHYGSTGVNIRVGVDLQPWFLDR